MYHASSKFGKRKRCKYLDKALSQQNRESCSEKLNKNICFCKLSLVLILWDKENASVFLSNET